MKYSAIQGIELEIVEETNKAALLMKVILIGIIFLLLHSCIGEEIQKIQKSASLET